MVRLWALLLLAACAAADNSIVGDENSVLVASDTKVCLQGDGHNICSDELESSSSLRASMQELVDGASETAQQGLDGLSGVVASNHQSITNSLSMQVSALTSTVSDVTSGLSTSVEQAESKATKANDMLASTLRAEMFGQVADAISISRSHAEGHVSIAVEDLNTNQSGAMQDLREDFEEVVNDLQAPGMFEYAFNGSTAINNGFRYWFSVDYGGQGADTGDSSHVGNWFLEYEFMAGHCGGGCHGGYRLRRMYLNGYCSVEVLSDTSRIFNGHGDLAFSRVADGYNGHGFGCGTFYIMHVPGAYSYGGTYWLKVRSSKPLRLNRALPEGGDCSMDCSKGNQCGGGRCPAWACRVTNCPGHKIWPSACGGASTYLSNGAENYNGACNVP